MTHQLILIEYALAAVRDEDEISEEVLGILRKVARDVVPKHRLLVLEALVRVPAGHWAKVRQVTTSINYPPTTTREILEDLGVLSLAETFTGVRALDVATPRIQNYILERQQENAAPGTINRELSSLRRMHRLGAQDKERIRALQHRQPRRSDRGDAEASTIHRRAAGAR